MPEKARHYEGVRREVGLGVALPEGEHHDSNRQDDHDTSIRSESRRRSSHDFRAPVPVTTGRFARFRLRSFPSGEPVPSCVLLDAGVHRLLRDSELAADFAIGDALFNAEPITLGHADLPPRSRACNPTTQPRKPGSHQGVHRTGSTPELPSLGEWRARVIRPALPNERA